MGSIAYGNLVHRRDHDPFGPPVIRVARANHGDRFGEDAYGEKPVRVGEKPVYMDPVEYWLSHPTQAN